MTILQLIPWFPDVRNTDNPTAGTFFKEQFKYLACNVDLVVIQLNFISIYDWIKNYDRLFRTEIIDVENYYVHRINVPSIPKFEKLTYSIATFLSFRQLTKKKIDIINAHVTLPTGLIAYGLSKKLKVPYLITEHATYFNTFSKTEEAKKVILNALIYVAVSIFLKKKVVKSGADNCLVLPNSINTDEFSIKGNPEHENINLIHISSLNEAKNFTSLLEAFRMLNKEYKMVKLHVIGGGNIVEKYKILSRELNIEDKVIFYKNLPNKKIKQILPTMDALVISSIRETFAVVGIEALASGIPVVTTKCGGPEGYVNNDRGVISEGFDPDSLYKAMKVLIINLNKFDSFLIRKYAIENFDAKIIGDKYIKLYKSLIGDKN